MLTARGSKAFGSLLGHGWKGATKTNARRNKPSVVATFFVDLEGSKCASLTLAALWGTPSAWAVGIKLTPAQALHFCQIWTCWMIQMFGNSLWIVLPFVSAQCQAALVQSLGGVGAPGMVGSCSPARVGPGSEALSWAENTLQLVTHMGQLISI